MNISSKVKQKIEALPEGAVITFDDFSELPNKRAVALCLSRLKKEGELERLEKGKYYIPKKTKFGTLGPSESSIIQGLLKGDEGSYISGVTAYNKLGLTTQVANEITIVGSKYNRKAIVGKIKVKYIKGKAPVNKQNILLLQILDAVNDVKKIIMPDQEKDKQFNLWGLIILLVSVTAYSVSPQFALTPHGLDGGGAPCVERSSVDTLSQ